MPPQVWHPGARVSRPHPYEYAPPPPGLQRRKKRRIHGTLIGAVANEPGRFNVRWDDGARLVGDTTWPQSLKLNEDGAGRHALSLIRRPTGAGPSQQPEDAPEEEGDDREVEESDSENISVGGDHGANTGDEGGNDDVQGG